VYDVAGMRITGLTSGLDIDQMVTKLMLAQRVPLDKLNQKKTTMEWQREQYRDLNLKIVDFRNNKLMNYSMSSAINGKKATVTGNTAAVSAKADPNAVTGNMSVEVEKLATSSSLKSKQLELDGNGDEVVGTGGIGKVDANKTILADLGLGDISFSLKNGSTDSVTISANANDTLASVIASINKSSANVNAFLDSETGRLSITSKSTGEGLLSVTDDPNGFMAKFNLTSAVGTDAKLKINGIETTRASNTFTENGVEITLNVAAPGSISTITIGTDTDKILDTIKSFITDYNGVLDAVNGKLSEEKYRKYTPLTSEQKEEMKDKEIELWEEKAKSGLLRRDITLTSMLSDMRLAAMTDVEVNGQSVNLFSLGIGTGDWTQRGKLVIQDEAKLRAAIESDPDKLMALFSQSTTEPDKDKKKLPTTPDSGLFNRLSNVLSGAMENLSKQVGTSPNITDKNTPFKPESIMGEELWRLDKKIADMMQLMTRKEAQYYKQFTAMETAMNRYNSQSTALFSS
jgi:flagellar hook-associated protein 2